jgi:lipoate---protein ligase
MTAALRVLLSSSTNPWFNLAVEDRLFRELPPDQQVLLLWRNDPTVVIGRHQNPWLECNLRRMVADGVILARRQSGGGAVYHDLGNTNFTFVSPADGYDREINFEIVLKALHSLGITAMRSGRNDILVSTNDGDRKISGNAFKHTRSRCFHHGTLLVRADLGRLTEYLNPRERVVEARGTKSVRSPVANLAELPGGGGITHESICAAMEEAFRRHYGRTTDHREVREEDLADNTDLHDYYRTISGWDWCFGATPSFQQTIALGGAEVKLKVDRGVIDDVVIQFAVLEEGLRSFLKDRLAGIRYDETAVRTALAPSTPRWAVFLEELVEQIG